MENKEYYTPNEDELFIGYGCEHLISSFYEGFIWEPYIIKKRDIGDLLDITGIRTPYLCKQDIIDLGWIDTEYGYFDISLSNTDDYLHRLRFLNDKNRDGSPSIEIIFIGAFDRSTVFYGKCKSKNELKKLMKDYLNIPI